MRIAVVGRGDVPADPALAEFDRHLAHSLSVGQPVRGTGWEDRGDWRTLEDRTGGSYGLAAVVVANAHYLLARTTVADFKVGAYFRPHSPAFAVRVCVRNARAVPRRCHRGSAPSLPL